MYNRFLYQRSSDFGRRWPSPRTISLCPYKDSSSAPFYPMSPRGATSRHLFAPFSPSTNPPAPIPLAPIPLGLIASQHQSPPLPYSTNNLPKTPPPPYCHPLPQTAPPLKPPHTTLSTRFTECISGTPTTHILRCPTESTLRAPATQGFPHPTTYREPYEALSMLGVVYTRVHSCVHTCTVMYTRVYNRAFIPISF